MNWVGLVGVWNVDTNARRSRLEDVVVASDVVEVGMRWASNPLSSHGSTGCCFVLIVFSCSTCWL